MTSILVVNLSLSADDGAITQSTKGDAPTQIVIGNGSISPAFELELAGAKAGDIRKFTLDPEDCFGNHNPDLVQHMPRERFSPDQLEEGNVLAFDGPNGDQIPGIITEIVDASVTVDFNHPLSGKEVEFEVEVIEVKHG